VLRKKGKPDPTLARAEKRTAARFYQLKSGHVLMGVYLKSTNNRPDDHCWWCDPENTSGTHRRGATCLSTVPGGRTSRPSCRRRSRRPPRGRSGSGVAGSVESVLPAPSGPATLPKNAANADWLPFRRNAANADQLPFRRNTTNAECGKK